jgi:hypothetical protein
LVCDLDIHGSGVTLMVNQTHFEIIPPHTYVKIEIVHDADWYDPMPALKRNGVPIDLTNKYLYFYLRPDYDYAPAILTLQSPNAGIEINDAVNGLATLEVPRATVQTIPVGAWKHYLVLHDPTLPPPLQFSEIWRGDLYCYAGLTGAIYP